MEWENLDVEVDLLDGGVYQGKIKNITEDGVLVTFEDNLKPEQHINFDNVKLPQQEDTNESSYKNGDIVQVYSKADGEVLEGWWKASIKLIKDDWYYVEFIDRDGQDLVQCDKLRYLKLRESFKKLTVQVPRNLGVICEEENAHADIIQHSGALTVIYSQQKSALIFVSSNGTIHKKAKLLADTHVKALKKKLQQKQTNEKRKYTETFKVPSSLMGLAIGKQGKNINQAEKLQGVSSIRREKCGDCFTFRVTGETQDAVKKARSILEFCEDTFKVPRQFAGLIIGTNGKHMDHIVTKSLVNRIRVDEFDDGPMLTIIGSQEAVEQAKLLLSFRLSELQNQRQDNSLTRELIKSETRDDTQAVVNDEVRKTDVKTETIKININRQPGLGFGFSIAGGKGANPYKEDDHGIYVCKVTADSPAARAGVKVGDNLISINEREVDNLNHYAVKEYIKSCTKHIKLVLKREKELDSDEDDDIIPRNINREIGLAEHTLQQDIFTGLSNQTGSRGRGGRGSRIRGRRGNRSSRGRGNSMNVQSDMFEGKSDRSNQNEQKMHKAAMELDQSGSKPQNSTSQKTSNVNRRESNRLRKGDRAGSHYDIHKKMEDFTTLSSDDEDIALKGIKNAGKMHMIKTKSNYDSQSSSVDCSSIEISKPRTTAQNVKFESFASHIKSGGEIESTQKLDIKSRDQTEACHPQCERDLGIGGSAKGEENKVLKKFDKGSRHSGKGHSELKKKSCVHSQLCKGSETKGNNEMLNDKQEAKGNEDMKKIKEIDLLRFLVQTFGGGCSFNSFICSAHSLYPSLEILEEWFETRAKKFYVYKNDNIIVYIAPFYKDINVCKHFLNPSNPSRCENENCSFFHICRNYVRGNCKRQICCFPHNLSSPHNCKVKQKFQLEDFRDSDIIVLLNWKFPRLCPNYIYKGSCPKVESKDDECPYLHYCKNHFFGKCQKGDNCKFIHSFDDPHNTWVLYSCHLGNQSDEFLKKCVYVPPRSTKAFTPADKDVTMVTNEDDSSEETCKQPPTCDLLKSISTKETKQVDEDISVKTEEESDKQHDKGSRISRTINSDSKKKGYEQQQLDKGSLSKVQNKDLQHLGSCVDDKAKTQQQLKERKGQQRRRNQVFKPDEQACSNPNISYDELNNSQHKYQQSSVQGETLISSMNKFSALLIDKPEEAVKEMDVLKYLVQTFGGGCSFGAFGCTAYELFSRNTMSMKEWFNCRAQRFHIYRNGSEIVYIAPFYKELNCSYFHICRSFVRGNCKALDCSLPHDFSLPHNSKIKQKFQLEDFTDTDIVVLLNWKFSQLCPNYIYKGSCPEVQSKDEECPYLHYCKNYFFGKCLMGDNCKFNHSFHDPHNKWVLYSCHLGNQTDDFLKKTVYVPPRPNVDKDVTMTTQDEALDTAEDYVQRSNKRPHIMTFDPLKPSTLTSGSRTENNSFDDNELEVLSVPSFQNKTSANVSIPVMVKATTHHATVGISKGVLHSSLSQYATRDNNISSSSTIPTTTDDTAVGGGRELSHQNLSQNKTQDNISSSSTINTTTHSATVGGGKQVLHQNLSQNITQDNVCCSSSVTTIAHNATTESGSVKGVSHPNLSQNTTRDDFNSSSSINTTTHNATVGGDKRDLHQNLSQNTTPYDLSSSSTLTTTTHNATVSSSKGTRSANRFGISQQPFSSNQCGGLQKYGIIQQRITEDTPESDDCLLSDSAGKKNICLSLTKRECPSPACQHLHLQNGVPYLWQIKIDEEWASFLPKDNFEIEKAYCSLADNVFVKGMVVNESACSIEINFMKHEKDMYGIIYAESSVDIIPVAKIRRLSTPSFGEASVNVDSYVTQWRWFWKDDNGIWRIYDLDLQIYTLEVKFLQQQKTYLFSRDNYRLKYRMCFKFMEQVNLEYGTKREIVRRPIFVSKSDLQSKKYPQRIVSTAIELFGGESKPAHFVPWDLANEFELVELDPSSGDEYTEVLRSFQLTMSDKKYDVKVIYRVQSRKLWLEYDTKKKHMYADSEKDNPAGTSIDERNLFHGTDTMDVCRGICINNFDFRKSGKNATVYGQGSYFARDAKYSHHYTKPTPSGDRFMFSAKVLVGKFTQGQSDYRRPPEIPKQSHKLYDSCVDNPLNPSIFVIFDRSQSYPEYLINYSEKEVEQSYSQGYSTYKTGNSALHTPHTSSHTSTSGYRAGATSSSQPTRLNQTAYSSPHQISSARSRPSSSGLNPRFSSPHQISPASSHQSSAVRSPPHQISAAHSIQSTQSSRPSTNKSSCSVM